VLSGFGLANMLAAAPAGRLVDRRGGVAISAAGALAGAAVLAVIPAAPGPVAVAGALLAGGVAVAALWAGLTTLAVQAVPDRRATASSLFNAWKFVGYALAPIVYTPLYTTYGPAAAFGAAALASLLILVPLATLVRGRVRVSHGRAAGSAKRSGVL
jgi:MFS family permease